jgi:hypothetical protein
VGPGSAALKRDPAGRYYLLMQRSRGGSTILICDKQGKLMGQIPPAESSSRDARLAYAQDFDVDSAILVEPDRLLLASDTLGVFEFARPDEAGPR